MRYFKVFYIDKEFSESEDEVWNTLAYEAPKAKMVVSNLERMGCEIVKLEEAVEECGV